LPELDRGQFQKKHTAIISSDENNTLTSEVFPCVNNFTCLVCDGSGQIRNDVPLKDALLEIWKQLTNIKEKN